MTAVFLPPSASRPDRPDIAITVVAGVLLLCAALSLARAGAARVVAALAAVGGTVVAATWLVTDVQGGVPGPAIGVLTVGALAVATGTTAGAVSSGTRGWRVHRLAAIAVVVLTAASAVVASVVVVDLPVRASTADTAQPATPAQRPGSRTWSWQPPAAVLEVVAAGTGVVVALADGSVVALDGPTGTPRWQHARVGTHVRGLIPTPDRATVLVAFDPDARYDTTRQLLVTLDATTGSVRHERLIDDVVVQVTEIAPTTHTLPLRERYRENDFRTLGYDLATGELRWTWAAPAGCTSPFILIASGRQVALAPLLCPDRVALVALDELTGAPRWQHEFRTTKPAAEESEDMFLDASPDGALLSLQVLSERLAPDTAHRVLLDADTGAVLTEVAPDTWPAVEAGPVPVITHDDGGNTRVIESLEPATGARRPLNGAGCESMITYVTTATSFIRACSARGAPAGDLTLVTQDLSGEQLAFSGVRLGGDNEVTLSLLRRSSAIVVAAPGAIVVARATSHDAPPALVVGLAVS